MTRCWRFDSRYTELERRLRGLTSNAAARSGPRAGDVGSKRVIAIATAHVSPVDGPGPASPGGAWRTAMAGHARQFLAESDGLTMMVDIAPDPASCDEFLLTGQLVGYRSVASIQAVRSGAELGLAIVDQFGQFELRASDAGLIELIVSDADREYIVAVHL